MNLPSSFETCVPFTGQSGNIITATVAITGTISITISIRFTIE